MGGVRIVTDSAADLPPEVAAAHGIEIVPLSVRFGSESFLSGVELGSDDFWKKLRSSSDAPSTAAPSAGDFQTTYEKLADGGATGIVSLHLSSKLSATFQSAEVAAKQMGNIPVECVDTLAVSAGTGLMAVHAAERAASGLGAVEIAQELTEMRTRVHLYGVIDTLEYLRRGGRIGGAAALLGTMLKVKPVIGLENGVVEPVDRVRTRVKALQHVVGVVKQYADRIGRLVVVEGEAPDTEQFVSMLSGVIAVSAKDVWPFGPIVGAHAGPGVIGVCFTTTS